MSASQLIEISTYCSAKAEATIKRSDDTYYSDN